MQGPKRASPLDTLLGVITDVRAGEGTRALAMMLSVFLLLCAYYVIKTVREPMLLATGSAELKSYAAAGQAVALLGFVPLYGWLSTRLTRGALIVGVSGFFMACLVAFYPAALRADAAPIGEAVSRAVTAESFFTVGFVFYVWVGIFSLATIAQFWSFANDIYSKAQGERLFPMIGIGMTSGAALGSLVPDWLASVLGIGTPEMLLVAAGLLAAHTLLLLQVHRSTRRPRVAGAPVESTDAPLEAGSGFAMLFRDRYLLLIAAVILLLNIVNTLGEFLLSGAVLENAQALVAAGDAASVGDAIRSFYGRFFFVVNIATFLIQTFVVSRVVKYGGLVAVLFALPLISLGAYSLLALGAGFAVFRVAKMAENTTDYSVMNTGKSLLWLPTSREAKYKAKQAVDTFVVRLGDLAQAGIVFAGIRLFDLSTRQFALVNVAMVGIWLGLTFALIRAQRAFFAADPPTRPDG